MLVLAFAAGAFLVAAALVVFVALVALVALVAFAALGAAAVFLVVAVLVAVFFAAGAFLVVAFVALVVFLASAGESSFLAVFLAAAGLAVAFASFTGPEGPVHHIVSDARGAWVYETTTRWNAGDNAQRQGTTAPWRADHHVLHRSIGKHTLRAVEGAVLGALGEGPVEERGEGGLLGVAESVVLPDKLLEGLATVESITVSKDVRSEKRCLALRFGSPSTTRCVKYLRATVTLLEL